MVHTTSRMLFSKKNLGPCAAKDSKRLATINNINDSKLIHKIQEPLAVTKMDQEP
jgi:hypothetical protein